MISRRTYGRTAPVRTRVRARSHEVRSPAMRNSSLVATTTDFFGFRVVSRDRATDTEQGREPRDDHS